MCPRHQPDRALRPWASSSAFFCKQHHGFLRVETLDSLYCHAYTSAVDELLAAILGAIAEFLLEAFLELIAAAVLDLASRALLGLFKRIAGAVKDNRVLMGLIYVLLGA